MRRVNSIVAMGWMVEARDVVQIGLGPIGVELLAAANRHPALNPVAAVDQAPDLAGVSLDTVRPDLPPLAVRSALSDRTEADLALVATTSRIRALVPLAAQCARAGIHVVSTCEELAFPWVRHPQEAERIDELAREAGIVVVGGGINPGYLMDALPAMLRWPMTALNNVRVTRVVDTSRRRLPLIRKTGAGMSAEEFQKLVVQARVGHVGLIESADLLATALGTEVSAFETSLEAVIAEGDLAVGALRVPAGRVSGQHQVFTAQTSGNVSITMTLTMSLFAQPYDEIALEGTPPITWRASAGIDGDIGTVGAMMQLAQVVGDLAPGLRTMVDLIPCVKRP